MSRSDRPVHRVRTAPLLFRSLERTPVATRVIQWLSGWKSAACEQCVRPRRRPVGSPRQREAEKVLLEALLALRRISLPSQSGQGRRDGRTHRPTARALRAGRHLSALARCQQRGFTLFGRRDRRKLLRDVLQADLHSVAARWAALNCAGSVATCCAVVQQIVRVHRFRTLVESHAWEPGSNCSQSHT